ncbi:hypothetical protein GA0111570_110104 [Raineyella antarctica]|uniref:PH domain-containing protein n=1 Tax=Raineyella antarctica TaxID=1577474 RepID=A0A1G6HIV8_9ACTN|nr:hypothetical protein [Raineyella antarctica]SDB94083.1 hypothetical protein GA0111570_110104 [Raineyella antarctica]
MSEERYVSYAPRVALQALPAVALFLLALAWIALGAGGWRWAGVGLALAAVLLGMELVRASMVVLDDEGFRHPGGRTVEWTAVEDVQVVPGRQGRTLVATTGDGERELFGERWRHRPEGGFEDRVARCRTWARTSAGPTPRRALPPEPGHRRGRGTRQRDGLGERGLTD